MNHRVLLLIFLFILFASVFGIISTIEKVEAGGTIYIRPDGSVDPDTAPISSVDNITYTFTDNIHDEIVVERDNIVVDGADYTVQGTGEGNGIYLEYMNNVTLKDVEVLNFNYGIRFYRSHYNVLAGNTVLNNTHGIALWYSDYNVLVGNIASNNTRGITLASSSDNNVLTCNTASNNTDGIYIYKSRNTVFHNNFINNEVQVYSDTANTWNAGYPSGGNYWSNYTGVDLDHDGIGDTEHVIDENNTDRYPLIGVFHSFNTSLGYNVNVISNSTIEDFEYFESNSTIRMYVSGEEGFGFSRVCIPYTLIDVDKISVIIDNGLTPILYHNYTLYDNSTNRWIYFAYPHSTHKVDIIPEFPSFLVLPLFMIATLLAVIFYKRKISISTQAPNL